MAEQTTEELEAQRRDEQAEVQRAADNRRPDDDDVDMRNLAANTPINLQQLTGTLNDLVSLIRQLSAAVARVTAAAVPVEAPVVKSSSSVLADPDVRSTAERKLATLRQTTSVAAYAAEFQRYCFHLDDTPHRIAKMFYAGLKTPIKDEVHRRGKPQDVTSMIALAVQVDDHLLERELERREEDVLRFRRSTSAPFAKLSQADRDYRMTNRLCLYCGGPDHIIRNCPTKPDRPGRSVAALSNVNPV